MGKQKVALVLSMGGARGIAHIGVIEELLRHNYEITSIAGSSMGAMVGRRMYQARSRYPLFNSTQNRERNNGYHSRANQQSA